MKKFNMYYQLMVLYALYYVFSFLKGKKDMDLHVFLCNCWTNCYWINTLTLSLIFLNFIIDISLAVEDFECFLCPQCRDMEENLLPYGGELGYHIFKLSNAPRLARGGHGHSWNWLIHYVMKLFFITLLFFYCLFWWCMYFVITWVTSWAMQFT